MILLIALIALSIQTGRSLIFLGENKKLALENGADKEDYDILQIGVSLYFLGFILIFFFPGFSNILVSLILIILFLPAIYAVLKLSKQLDKGHDCVRKVGKNINQMAWLGYAGIAIIILNFAFNFIISITP